MVVNDPGANGCGKVRQGMLERSNVDIALERAEWTNAKETLSLFQSLQNSPQ